MKPHERLGDTTAPDGTLLRLTRHDGQYYLRAGGTELMSTRRSHSEEELARLACSEVRDRPKAAVLIGGLGFGFTLRAALATLADDATVVVAELLPAVVAWNREPTWGLAHDALSDPRVHLIEGDVLKVLRRSPGAFDAVILDVDNGAEAFTTAGNATLYSETGIALTMAACRPRGVIAYWCANDEPRFTRRLRSMGLRVEVLPRAVYPGARTQHTILLARTQG
jgi:spermidine synthase